MRDNTAAFMRTYGGNRFYYPAHLRDIDAIDITDIAHALSNICRFGGHCPDFYSVAQHSVLVSHLVPKEHALAALLHDATEAYLSDVVRPAKRMLPQYKSLEDEIHEMIQMRFMVSMDHKSIKEADNKALYAEAMCFFGDVTDWKLEGYECAAVIVPLSNEEAKSQFLHRFIELTEG